jgi:hypothetical protein
VTFAVSNPARDARQRTEQTPSRANMSDPRHDEDPSVRATETSEPIVRYPENHVLAIVDSEPQLESVVQALESSGFLDTEVSIACGQSAADLLNAHTGRRGLTDLVIRVANRLGLQNEESETKDRYETALRDGQFVLAVLAPTDARKELAAQLLTSHGAHFVNFLGRFSIERLSR